MGTRCNTALQLHGRPRADRAAGARWRGQEERLVADGRLEPVLPGQTSKWSQGGGAPRRGRRTPPMAAAAAARCGRGRRSGPAVARGRARPACRGRWLPSSRPTVASTSLRQVGPARRGSRQQPSRVRAPSSPGRATTGIICGRPTLLRTPRTVERSRADGRWYRQRVPPPRRGRRPAGSARPRRRRRRGGRRRRGRGRPRATPPEHQATRVDPGSRAAAAIAAR